MIDVPNARGKIGDYGDERVINRRQWRQLIQSARLNVVSENARGMARWSERFSNLFGWLEDSWLFRFCLQGDLGSFKSPFFIFTRTVIILVRNMAIIKLRKVTSTDKKYFARWWRDKKLLKLTSGILRRISDKEVNKYFLNILESKKDCHFMITLDSKVIGHISLAKRRNNWYETQIVIGEKKYWGKGYGSQAITLLIKKAKKVKISKIYLEVRPTNIRAIHAYEKCGFQKVRVIRYPKNKYLSKALRMELVK